MDRDEKGRFLKGYKHTEEEKLRIGLDHLGSHLTEATKEKIRLSQLGEKGNNFGKHHSEETKVKLSLARQGRKPMLGKKHSEETKRKFREIRKGDKAPNFGKHFSEESKLKMSLNHADFKGEKSGKWKGGITPEYHKIRTSNELKTWRKSVFKRDNYTCQKCRDNKGGNLNAHHVKAFIEYPELRFVVSNGITYCKDCHENNGLHKGIGKLRLQTA